MTSAVTERALSFVCDGEALVGILHAPHTPADVGVVVVVGGPQYRAGSHRHFVQLARVLAASGYAVLRFDVRGMGDSSGMSRDFQSISADIGAAIDALQSQLPEVRNIVLCGLCDGASAALLYLDDTADRRIAGLCLLNPWVRTEAGLARTHVKHYYVRRLKQREFWAKLLRGEVGRKAWNGLLANLQAHRRAGKRRNDNSFQSRMARAWSAFDKNILLVLSSEDYTAREFVEFTAEAPEWRKQFERPTIQRLDLLCADHTLSDSGARQALAQEFVDWLGRSYPPAVASLVQESTVR
jgi:exosortase A-associated hydrolase 1